MVDLERAAAAAHAHDVAHGKAPQKHIPRIAIVTCSDTRTLEEDSAGAALEDLIRELGWKVIDRTIVPDRINDIGAAIVRATDELDADVVLTCGGSGLSLRDVTPEATQLVCQRNVPGIVEAMRAYSFAITPNAALSRAVCMQRDHHLVVNLPGSEKAARENWEGLKPMLPHAISMMAGEGH
ncbi:MogA/MoaB family molybdenum cofactor biosynthesis protein [Curtanaerobium respiraculi]|uniref:MogA/MoaB family molybdenum cofactor biosynthesis protein n=1 Tax=Curtanaerobium respiraculi TaxID=2949669 RepID=UPI0024B3547C|nr:MogA/MoaB family molybdenum cofactor biosynthesis protein [Curtanaerobium respiraculi]